MRLPPWERSRQIFPAETVWRLNQFSFGVGCLKRSLKDTGQNVSKTREDGERNQNQERLVGKKQALISELGTATNNGVSNILPLFSASDSSAQHRHMESRQLSRHNLQA